MNEAVMLEKLVGAYDITNKVFVERGLKENSVGLMNYLRTGDTSGFTREQGARWMVESMDLDTLQSCIELCLINVAYQKINTLRENLLLSENFLTVKVIFDARKNIEDGLKSLDIDKTFTDIIMNDSYAPLLIEVIKESLTLNLTDKQVNTVVNTALLRAKKRVLSRMTPPSRSL